jgi:integrase
VTQTPEQFAGGTPSSGGSDGKVSAVPAKNQSRAESAVISSLSSMPAPIFLRPEVLCGLNDGASITSNCATLPPQGQRVSGPEVKMARRRYQKGSIRLRGRQWTLRWREDVVLADGTVKREQRTTLLGTLAEILTKSMAKREAEAFLARVNRLDYRPVKRATFAEFAENWKKQVIDLLKPSTAKVMGSHLRFHLVPAFGRVRLDEIGQEQVQDFVGKLAKGKSRHTILNVLGTLASVLKMARKWGYAVAGFQHADLVIPCSKPGKPGRFFTAEQVRSILALALEPCFTIFALAAMTGLRPGEVLGLSIDDLDFEQRLIFVRRSAWYRHLISPKSKRSMATVPIPGPLAEILTNFLASWRPNEKRLLFSNRRGNPYSENKVVQKRLWPILDALSIPRCGMHAFRHAHGTLMQSNEVGASVKATQNQLRHADAGTTMNMYVHGIPSEQRDASEKLARILCPNVAEMRSDVAKSEKKSVHVN